MESLLKLNRCVGLRLLLSDANGFLGVLLLRPVYGALGNVAAQTTLFDQEFRA